MKNISAWVLGALILCVPLLQGCQAGGNTPSETLNPSTSVSTPTLTPDPDRQAELAAEVESSLRARADTVDVTLATGETTVDFRPHEGAVGLVVTMGCVGTGEEKTIVWVKIRQDDLEPALGVECDKNGSSIGIGEPHLLDLTSPITLEISQEGPEQDLIYVVMAGSILLEEIVLETPSATPNVS